MITFVAKEEHQYTVRDVLETRHHPLHGRIVILSYEELVASARLPRAAYVFADLERLDVAEMRRVMARIDAMRQVWPDVVMLNLPDQVGNRLDIMRRLHEAGINDFRMLPITTPPEVMRYPVFLRRLDDHTGPRSDLLQTPEALQKAISALDLTDQQSELFAITEYVDARNASGLHEKRSYTRVGDRLFPSAMDQSRNWVCKGEYADLDTVPNSEREMEFLRGHADQEVLRAAFDAARIQYGRADYALVGGRPQIFEINTNPWLEPPERVPTQARSGAQHIIRAWLDALGQLDDKQTSPGEWFAVPQASSRVSGRLSRRRLARSILGAMHQLHNETNIMRWLRLFRLM